MEDPFEQHRNRFQMLRHAQCALLVCIGHQDLTWILEEYFSARSKHVSFLIAACVRFPDPDIAVRIMEDARKGESWSAVALTSVPFPNREMLFDSLMADSGLPIREFVGRCRRWGCLTPERTLGAKW